MKRVAFMIVYALICGMVFTNCNKDEPKGEEEIAGIEDISFANFPKMDGSTSTSILNRVIACQLLGVRYSWLPPQSLGVWGHEVEWKIEPEAGDIPQQFRDNFFTERVKTSQTNGAFMNLINGNVDIILTHRTISPDEKAQANSKGVSLLETSIALDAFVFILNINNPVKSLTVNQVQEIYTSKITNWSEVGGNNARIDVFTRPRNSGSEEVFRIVVMNGITPDDFPEESGISTMGAVFYEVNTNPNGICYTFNNYKDMIVRCPDSEVPKIAINGIFPDENTVKNRTYPFISEVHVAIRSDLDPNSMAYKLYEWLQTENVNPILTECGFLWGIP